MGFLGGKPAKQSSKNKAYGFATYNYGPWAGWGNSAMNAYGGILGLNNPGFFVDPAKDGIDENAAGSNGPGYTQGWGQPTSGSPYGAAGGGYGGGGNNQLGALSNYFNSSGGQFQLNQGLDALGSKLGAMGLSKSGAAMKAMEQYRHDLVSTKLDNYLGQLNEMARLSLGAGGLVTGAGQVSSGSGGKEGLGSFIGPIATAIAASSRDLKDDIEVLGPWDDQGDGLEKVSFRYKSDPTKTRYVGVIAEQVEQLRPWAFVPNFVNGKPGVNYALLSEAR